MLSSALMLAAQALSPQWAPVGLMDDEGTTVFFVDRSSIETRPDGSSAWVYSVSTDVALRLHFDYDCKRQRYRALEASLGSAAAEWAPIKPQSPLHNMMKYVCADGKIDLGFGDLVVPAESPEAFAREFIARRSARK